VQRNERFTRLSVCSEEVQMLNLDTKIALPVGVNLHQHREHALSVGVMKKSAKVSFYYSDYMI